MKRQAPKDPIINKILGYDPDDVYYAEELEIEEINNRYGIAKKRRTKSLQPLPSEWVKLHLFSLDEEDLIKVLKYLRKKDTSNV